MLQALGKIPCEIERLQSAEMGFANMLAPSFKNVPESLSTLAALHLLGLSHKGYLDNAFDNVALPGILEKKMYYLRAAKIRCTLMCACRARKVTLRRTK